MTHRTRDRLWTEAEFLALPETTRRVELLDGEVLREPSAGFGHQRRQLRLGMRLELWASGRDPRPDVVPSPLDVRFGPGRILQPDVVVFLQPLSRPVRMPIDRIPDLCVEVASRRRAYDRVTKRQVYAEAGVREYWVLVPDLGCLERFAGTMLREREEIREILRTPMLPGFALDVARLLAEP